MTLSELVVARPRLAVLRARIAVLGPAFVAAVAYVDPGNFATNSAAGARYGHRLVWVVVAANAMAMLVQTLSAKLGIATGRSLPELCRIHYRRPTVVLLWIQAELVALATDLAEVIGGAIGLSLLFGWDLLPSGLVVTAASFGILALRTQAYRRFEFAIAGLLAVIVAAFALTVLRGGIDLGALAGGLRPRFGGPDSIGLAAGMLGATVMPHVIYAHSALTRDRYRTDDATARRAAVRAQRTDVFIALGCAGVANLAILLVAASVASHGGAGLAGVADTLAGAHAGIVTVLGAAAGTLFAVALVASGLASTSVGTYAGEIIMAGFLQRRIPVVVRRLVTVIPALGLLAVGLEPTTALLVSQAVLSFGIPFALVPLLRLTVRRDVMGELVNRRSTTVAAVAVTGLVIALNGLLIGQLALG
jgi:manganese transport protein